MRRRCAVSARLKPRNPAPRVKASDLDFDTESMREESRAKAREERRLCETIRPVRVDYYPDKKRPVLGDGRHRLEAAKGDGAQEIDAVVTHYGPRGGVRSRRRGKVQVQE